MTKIPKDPSKCGLTICPTCGNEFTYYLSWPRKYCSHSCRGKAVAANAAATTRYSANCELCGDSFSRVRSQPGRFCGQKCFGRWQSANIRGDAHPNKGKTFTRPKVRVTLKCGVCEVAYQVKPSHEHRSKFCSKQCQGRWTSTHQRGENSPTWKGGYDPYYGPSWRFAMRAIRKRDGVCQRCGKTPEQAGKALDVHHLTPFRDFGVKRHAEANRLENLTALCNPCHLLVEWETNRRSG